MSDNWSLQFAGWASISFLKHGQLEPSPTRHPPTQTHFDANSAAFKTHPHQVDLFFHIHYVCIILIIIYM